MIYLYIKTHNITGLKYLGQTRSANPSTYRGSGKYWKSHLKIHGNDVSTTILKECETHEEIAYWGNYYTVLWDIVASNEWANLKPESGDGGSIKGVNVGRKHTAETKKLISEKKKGIPNPKNSIPRTAAQKEHISKVNKGRKLSAETRNKMKMRMIGFTHTEDTKQLLRKPKSLDARRKMTAAQRDRRSKIKEMWITDGINNSLVPINSKIPADWRMGRTTEIIPPSQKGKFWINNGIQNKMSNILLDGWTKGRIKTGE
jgi:NUMOD3 motif